MTDRQLRILRHSLGLDDHGNGQEYRNHFCACLDVGDPDLLAISHLVEIGLMKEGPIINEGRARYFTVTLDGRAAALKDVEQGKSSLRRDAGANGPEARATQAEEIAALRAQVARLEEDDRRNIDFCIGLTGKGIEEVREAFASKDRLDALFACARVAALARARLLADSYVPWSRLRDGVDMCAHGRADGVECPKCDREAVDAFFAGILKAADFQLEDSKTRRAEVVLERKRFEEWLGELKAWQFATFPGETIDQVYKHLQSEVGELGEKRDDPLEIADCLMLLFCLAFHQGIDPIHALRAKDAINRTRSWAKTEAGFRHVKPEGAAIL